MRLHPSTWLWLSLIALAALIWAMSFGALSAVFFVVSCGTGVHWFIGPWLSCQVCVQPFAYWGVRRFRILGRGGRTHWIATRRCWQHRHEGDQS